MEKRIMRKRLLNEFSMFPKEIRRYFNFFPDLILGLPLEISLAYLFMLIEKGHHRILYTGVVKKYRANSKVAKKIITSHYLNKSEFPKLYNEIFREKIPQNIEGKLNEARKIRNKVMHGKNFVIGGKSVEPRIRKAIREIFEYCNLMNENLKNKYDLKPSFGPLGGFGGRGKGSRLDENETELLLKRMGFKESGNNSGTHIN
jgi:hypothetical protein